MVLYVDDSPLHRNRHRMCAVVGSKFGQDVAHVTLDRLLRERQLRCDRLVRVSAGDEAKNINFARRQGVVSRVLGDFGGDLGRDALPPA